MVTGRVDRAPAAETVDCGSILRRVKPKTIKLGIHSFLALLTFNNIESSAKPPPCAVGKVTAWLATASHFAVL